jgi:hypothetical protein
MDAVVHLDSQSSPAGSACYLAGIWHQSGGAISDFRRPMPASYLPALLLLLHLLADHTLHAAGLGATCNLDRREH